MRHDLALTLQRVGVSGRVGVNFGLNHRGSIAYVSEGRSLVTGKQWLIPSQPTAR